MSRVLLKDMSTRAPEGWTKSETKKKTKELVDQLADLQHRLYATRKYSVLVVLQGMDSTGKDGSTRKVFAKCSPAGVRVKAFKKPTDEEFAHDFLWRIHKHAPEKGFIQIFNRSHYEDILIQRVHGWIDEEHVSKRIASINAFEELLQYDNDTIIIKCFLNISPERQLEKLQERIDDPTKNWKHNPGDWEERKHWDQYMNAYEDMINRCTVPWHIIPVDQRWYRDYCVAKIVVDELSKLEMPLPLLTAE